MNNYFFNEKIDSKTLLKKELKSMYVQFGPQHPGSHGLIRFTLELLGETIVNSILYIGLLHRGTEKLMETRPFYMGTPYMNRLDYVSSVASEHAHVLAIENLIDFKNNSSSFLKIRTVFDELNRILNHLMHIGVLLFDTGNFFIFFFFLEWREHLMSFFEIVTGARLHSAMYKPFENRFNYFNFFLIENINYYLSYFLFFFKNFFQPVLFFRIVKIRFVGVGVLSKNWSQSASISGVIARSAGLKYDVRLPAQSTYAFYKFIKFKTYIGTMGDLYDRIILMFSEIVESCIIITQVLFKTYLSSFNADFDTNTKRLHTETTNYMFYTTDHAKIHQYV